MVRKIQSRFVANLGDSLGIRTFLQHHGNRISRNNLQQDKGNKTDTQKYENGLGQTFCRIRKHNFLLI